MYYDFEEPIEKIAGYRILAINRGEKEGILQVKIEPDIAKITSYLARKNHNKGRIPIQQKPYLQRLKTAINV